MNAISISRTLVLASLLAGGSALAEPSGEMLGYTCAGCHGTDGSSVGPSSPHIAGMNEEYFIDAMTVYRDGGRNPTIMDRIAKGYTDDQIASMAKFFAAQKLRLTPQKHDAAKAKQGAEYHEKYCEKCHEDQGRDAGDSGMLAGQWAPYLKFSFDDFASGKRDMPKKMAKKMESMEKDHGEQAVEALIEFYASQH